MIPEGLSRAELFLIYKALGNVQQQAEKESFFKDHTREALQAAREEALLKAQLSSYSA